MPRPRQEGAQLEPLDDFKRRLEAEIKRRNQIAAYEAWVREVAVYGLPLPKPGP